MSKRLLLLAVTALLAISAGKVLAADSAKDRTCNPAVAALSSQQLDQAGMKVVWQTQLLKEKGRKKKEVSVGIRKVYLYDETILVESKDEFLYAFDRKTGQNQWIAALPDQLQIAPTLYDRRYWTLAAGRLTVLDNKGMVTVGPAFPVSPSAPLVVTDDYFFVASADGALYKFDKKELLPVWPAPARTDGAILGQPVRTEDLILFAASNGQVIGVDLITGGRHINIEGLGSILGGIATDWPAGNDFYFGTGDFHVYDYSVLGSQKWSTLLQQRPSGTPVIAGDTLYIDSIGGGLWALNRADGTTLWFNSGVGANIEWLPVADAQDEAKINDLRAGKSVTGLEWYPYCSRMVRNAADRGEQPPAGLLVTADENDRITGNMLSNAYAAKDREGKPEVAFDFNSEGQQRYSRMLAQHPGGRIAILINNEVCGVVDVPPAAPGESTGEAAASAPVAQSVLRDLNGAKEAKAIAASVNATIQKRADTSETFAFVAADASNVYRVTPDGQLWMLDAVTGRVKNRFPVPASINFAVRNTFGDGFVYLASLKDGSIYCITAR